MVFLGAKYPIDGIARQGERPSRMGSTWNTEDDGLFPSKELPDLYLVPGAGSIDGGIWDRVANLRLPLNHYGISSQTLRASFDVSELYTLPRPPRESYRPPHLDGRAHSGDVNDGRLECADERFQQRCGPLHGRFWIRLAHAPVCSVDLALPIQEIADYGNLTRSPSIPTLVHKEHTAVRTRSDQGKPFGKMTTWARVASKDTPAASAVPDASAAAQPSTAVVDANAIIAGLRLDRIAEQAVTIQEVLKEIRDKKSREYLESLPIVLKCLEPTDESVRAGRLTPQPLKCLATSGHAACGSPAPGTWVSGAV